jgi:hypothetical protein
MSVSAAEYAANAVNHVVANFDTEVCCIFSLASTTTMTFGISKMLLC